MQLSKCYLARSINIGNDEVLYLTADRYQLNLEADELAVTIDSQTVYTNKANLISWERMPTPAPQKDLIATKTKTTPGDHIERASAQSNRSCKRKV